MTKKKQPWDIGFMLGAARVLKGSAKEAVDMTDEAIFGAVNAVPGYPKLKSYGRALREHKMKRRRR